jgi:hypothetical protein
MAPLKKRKKEIVRLNFEIYYLSILEKKKVV